MRDELPVDAILPEVVATLRQNRALVLRAPPGAGKTTRVPPALLEEARGEIVVLEPRRLAARLSARLVASERGEALGETIGYQVRFEDVSGPNTRIRFVTEGVLTRRLASDPRLDRVSVVVLDEFHERHVQTDLALSLVRALQQGARPDLGIVVMSATLETGPLSHFLGDCPVLQAEGRRFEVAIEYQDKTEDRPLESLVVSAVRKLVKEGLQGDVLTFLPGAAEIRRASDALAPLAAEADLAVVALHGDLPLADQDRALAPLDRRKIVLSTNVAETSITVEGVVAVIDSGLARQAGHAAWSGLPVLNVVKISKASAAQRAGRAGRTCPGRCLRLYTRYDHGARPEHDVPEIRRTDLAEPLLLVRAMGVQDPAQFAWFEQPEASSLQAADGLLRSLGAIGPQGSLTQDGRDLLRFPVHPRLGRMLLEGQRRGVIDEVATVAALIGERDLSSSRRFSSDAPRRTRTDDPTSASDLLAAMERFDEAQARRFDPDQLRWAGIDAGAARSADRVRKQLLRICRLQSKGRPADVESAVLQSILAGYPDRVARRVRGSELALAAGGTASLSESSVVREAEYIVAVDAEGRGRKVVVRVASAIRPDWLLEMFPDGVRETRQAEWNAGKERVEVIERMQYGSLVLDESRDASATGEDVSRVLWEAAQAAGPAAFAKDDAFDRWVARVEFVAKVAPDAGLPLVGQDQAAQALQLLCEGRRSFQELREVGLLAALQQRLNPSQRKAVETLAPERVTLPGGRAVQVHYERGNDPWIESRLQDFFGMQTGPSIGSGRFPLVLHLLAPNHRAVQVTRDLSGFWERHYPAIRRELCRRYPRHPWPEDGRTATPPPATRRR